MKNDHNRRDMLRVIEKVCEGYEEASRRGIANPVFAVLQRDSPHARKIHAAVHGKPSPGSRKRARDDLGPLAVWGLSEAAGLLRAHCEIGGAAVANLLETARPRPEMWVLLLERPHLSVAGFGTGGVVLQSCAYYDDIPVLYPSTLPVREDGVTLLPLGPVGPGASVRVRGRSVDEAARAAALAQAVHRRALISLGDGEEGADLPVDDALLALILQKRFRDWPGAVAAAVRALRETENRGDRWLLAVLGSKPELRSLADQVGRHLAEPPARG
jgi:hypothetical protein